MERIKKFLLQNTTTGQTIIKNTVWLSVSQIGARLIRAALVIYAARLLGAADYGTFSYALSLAGLVTVFIDFGINALITREASRDLQTQERYFATALIIKASTLGLVLVAYAIATPLLAVSDGVAALLPLTMLVIFFDSMRDFAAALSRAWERMEVEAGIQITTNVAIVVAGVVALAASPHSLSLMGAYAVGTGAGMILAFYPFRDYLRNIKKTFDVSLVKPILISSWPFGLMGLMGGIMLNTDSIMLGHFRGDSEVGYYAAGLRITQLLYFLPIPLASALFPVVARLRDNRQAASELLSQAIGALTLVAVPLTVGGVVASAGIISLIYGDAYAASVSSFFIMNATYIPVFMSGVLGNVLFALNQEKHLLIYVTLGIIGNIALNLLLIPTHGGAGSAMATLINQILITAYLVIVVKQHLDLRITRGIWRSILAGLGATIVTVLVATLDSTVATLTACVLTYGACIILLREPLVELVRKKLLTRSS